MTRRRRRTSGPPKCTSCGRPIAWFKSPFTSGWRTFDPKPVDGRHHLGTAYPIDGGVRAWRFNDLVLELMGRWAIGSVDAADHVYAMPWHALHVCHPTTEPPDDPDQSWSPQ